MLNSRRLSILASTAPEPALAGSRIGLCREPPAQCLEDQLADGEAAVTAVRPGNDQPGGLGRAGHRKRSLGGGVQIVVALVVRPVARGDAPARLRVLARRLSRSRCWLPGQVDPELEHQRALVNEHPLEAHVLLHALASAARLTGRKRGRAAATCTKSPGTARCGLWAAAPARTARSPGARFPSVPGSPMPWVSM